MPDFELIVTTEFRGYVRGERITDQERIGEIMNSEHSQFVTQVQVQDPVQ